MARRYAEATVENDVIRLLDIYTAIKASLLMWIKHFEDYQSGLWQTLLTKVFENSRIRGTGERFGADPIIQNYSLRQLELPEPWMEIITIWRLFKSCLEDPVYFEDILLEPMMANSKQIPPESLAGVLALYRTRSITFKDIYDEREARWKEPPEELNSSAKEGFCRITRRLVLGLNDWLHLPMQGTLSNRSKKLSIPGNRMVNRLYIQD